MKPNPKEDNPESKRAEEPATFEPDQHQLLLEARSVIEDLHGSNTRATEFIRKIAGFDGEDSKVTAQGSGWAKVLADFAKGGNGEEEY